MQKLYMDNAQNGVDSSLYERFAVAIFQYLCQQVSNEQDAEDLLLEVFLAAFQDESLSNLPAERQLAWLRREQYAEQQENYERLYQSIAQLTSPQRELIRLRYRNGLRFFEIAAVLEKPEGTVRQMLVRTLRQLRTIYDQLERGEQR